MVHPNTPLARLDEVRAWLPTEPDVQGLIDYRVATGRGISPDVVAQFDAAEYVDLLTRHGLDPVEERRAARDFMRSVTLILADEPRPRTLNRRVPEVLTRTRAAGVGLNAAFLDAWKGALGTLRDQGEAAIALAGTQPPVPVVRDASTLQTVIPDGLPAVAAWGRAAVEAATFSAIEYAEACGLQEIVDDLLVRAGNLATVDPQLLRHH